MEQKSKHSKGVAIRFLALILITVVAIILIIAVLVYYAPELFKALLDLMPSSGG